MVVRYMLSLLKLFEYKKKNNFLFTLTSSLCTHSNSGHVLIGIDSPTFYHSDFFILVVFFLALFEWHAGIVEAA